MPPQNREAVLLKALAALDDKLTQVIQSGLAKVNQSIAEIQREHNATQLEQAKLNATFANRERVEDLARRVDANNSAMVDIHRRQEESESDRVNLRQAIEELTTHISQHNESQLSQHIAWLVLAMTNAGTAGLTFILTHIVR